MALDVDSDKFRSREEFDSAVQLQIDPVARCSWCVLYIGMSGQKIHFIISIITLHQCVE